MTNKWKQAVPTTEQQHELKRTMLVREAASAFSARGFQATSLAELAQRLGVSKSALYHYFPNKQKLLAECFARAMEVADENLQRAKHDHDNGLDILRHTLRGYLEQIIEELNCCIVLTEETELVDDDRERIVAKRDAFESELRQLVAKGIDDGSIVPCDPKLAIFVLLGAVNWVPKWYKEGGPWSGPQVAAAITDMVTRSIAADPDDRLATDVGALKLTPILDGSAGSGEAEPAGR